MKRFAVLAPSLLLVATVVFAFFYRIGALNMIAAQRLHIREQQVALDHAEAMTQALEDSWERVVDERAQAEDALQRCQTTGR